MVGGVAANGPLRAAVQELESWRPSDNPGSIPDEVYHGIVRNALHGAATAVKKASTIGCLPVTDLASTLIVIMAFPNGVAVGQIGDGAVVVEDRHQEIACVTTPRSGEYLNETTFLTSPNAIQTAQITVWRGDVRFVAAFTDGVQLLALRMSDWTPHVPFFSPLFQCLKNHREISEVGSELRSLLTSPRITERVDDDLTLLLAHWPG